MRILQINVTANWGSTGRIAEEIGQMAISHGCKSYIAYGRGNPQSQSRLISIGNDWDMKFHALQSRLLDNHGLISKRATQIFIEKIEEIAPDLIHLHNIHGYYLNYPLLFNYLNRINIPVVWTLHDCWSFTGHCAYYSYISCEKWKTLCYDCPLKKDYPSSWLMDRSEKNYQDKLRAFTSVKRMILVPVSEWLAGEVKQSFLKNYPMQVIHNGIDIDTFIPMQVRKSDFGFADKFVILGVASVWSPRKGLQDFISLRKKLSNEYVIVLVGLNEKQIKYLPKGIIGIKRTSSVQELTEYYSVADLYFNPSVEETFGLTIAESLSCGTPAVVYNSTACPEIISPETGFIVEQGDVDSVVDIVRRINETGKQQWTSACRERAVRLYNKRERYEEYLQLYEKMVFAQ